MLRPDPSPRKQAAIDAKNASLIKKGECVFVPQHVISDYHKAGTTKGDQTVSAKVLAVLPEDRLEIVEGDGSLRGYMSKVITIDQIAGRDLVDVGPDPFDRDNDKVRFVAFTLESILFNLDVLGTSDKHLFHTKGGKPIGNLNWDPFVYNAEGNEERYQRPFVWTLENKQMLIESVYNGIDCGRILIRKRGWAECERMETPFWYDIVDGKQRLNAVRGFILGEFPDMHGNYFADLSYRAQYDFTDHQLFAYAEMQEDTPDWLVIKQFLKLNFAGVPQSKEHIQYVHEIAGRMKGGANG